jgi:hypothetical protein
MLYLSADPSRLRVAGGLPNVPVRRSAAIAAIRKAIATPVT